MPIASVACTVLHRLGTLPWSSGLMSSRALCRGPRATKHQLLLLTWREEVAVHRGGDAPALQPLLREEVHHEIRRCDTIANVPRTSFRFRVGSRVRSCACIFPHSSLIICCTTRNQVRGTPPTHTRRRYVADAAAVLINITLATATLAAGAALADVNRVGRRAPREQRLYHVCVWPTAAACSRAVPPRKPS
jgi:hypothetical protein